MKWRGISKYHDVIAYGGNWSFHQSLPAGATAKKRFTRHGDVPVPVHVSLHVDRHHVHGDVRERSGHGVSAGCNPFTLLSRSTRTPQRAEGGVPACPHVAFAARRSS